MNHGDKTNYTKTSNVMYKSQKKKLQEFSTVFTQELMGQVFLPNPQ